MSYKKVIVGSLGVVTALGVFAAVGVAPTRAVTTGWQEVEVTVEEELILGGTPSSTTELTPTVSGGVASANGGVMTVTSNSSDGWKLQWQAVTGAQAGVSTTAAPGTVLGASGFAAAGATGYTYSGANAAASTTGNNWSAQIATGGSGATLAFTALSPTASTIVTGTSTSTATITPTYSAHTDGSVDEGTYYGTIYYNLTTNE
jgi:hypothetical protein